MNCSEDMKAHPIRHEPTVRTGLEGDFHGAQLYKANYEFRERVARERPVIKPSLMPRFGGVMGKDSTTYRCANSTYATGGHLGGQSILFSRLKNGTNQRMKKTKQKSIKLSSYS